VQPLSLQLCVGKRFCFISHYKTCGSVSSTRQPTNSWLLIQVVHTFSVLKQLCCSF